MNRSPLSRRALRTLSALAAAAALCACGSGGGGDGDAAAGAAGGGASANASSAASGSTGGAGAGSTGAASGSAGGTGTGTGTGSGSGSGSGGSGSGGSGTAGSGTAGSGSGGSESGSGGSGGTLPSGAPSVAAAGTLQQTAPTANYAGASTESAAWRDLNFARRLAGAGQLYQSGELDAAAAAHANYLVRNIGASGHAEAADKIDYYEATPGSRIAKAGFTASFWSETISDQRPQVVPLLDFDCAGELLNSVYNAVALLGPATRVGLRGWDGTYTGTQFCLGVVAAPASQPVGQVVPAGKFVAYPYDGQQQVIDSVDLRVESPRPSATVLPNALAGTPVIVNVRNADYLNLLAAGSLNPRITRFELRDAGGNAVPAALLAHAGLVAGSGVVLHQDAVLPVGAVVLVPLSPLPRGQSYTVDFAATLRDGGAVLAKTWSFTTRP